VIVLFILLFIYLEKRDHNEKQSKHSVEDIGGWVTLPSGVGASHVDVATNIDLKEV
jgi:hypothetical protein